MELLSDARQHVVRLRIIRAVLSVALGCLVWLSAIPAHADQIIATPPVVLPPGWDVTGALVIVGNNVCSGLPCTETIAFSFDLGYEFYPDELIYRAYISNVADNWSGALGPFSLTSTAPQAVNAAKYVVGFVDPAGDDIEISIDQGFVSTPPVTPSLEGADLWACGTTTCLTDFGFPFDQTRTPPIYGILITGPAEFTVTTIPEPATLTLLVCGLFLLGLVGIARGKITRLS